MSAHDLITWFMAIASFIYVFFIADLVYRKSERACLFSLLVCLVINVWILLEAFI